MSSGLSVFLFQTLSPSPSPPSSQPPSLFLLFACHVNAFSLCSRRCRLPPLSFSPLASLYVCLVFIFILLFFYTFTSHHPAPASTPPNPPPTPPSLCGSCIWGRKGRRVAEYLQIYSDIKCFQEKHKKDSVLSFLHLSATSRLTMFWILKAEHCTT